MIAVETSLIASAPSPAAERSFSAPSEILWAEPMKVIPGALVDFFSDGEIVAGVVLSEEKGRLRVVTDAGETRSPEPQLRPLY